MIIACNFIFCPSNIFQWSFMIFSAEDLHISHWTYCQAFHIFWGYFKSLFFKFYFLTAFAIYMKCNWYWIAQSCSVLISNSFSVDTFCFLYSQTYLWIMSFVSFLPILTPFISFSCLTSLARTSTTFPNTSGDRGHPYLVPDHKGKAFTVWPLSMMFAVVFCRCLLSD